MPAGGELSGYFAVAVFVLIAAGLAAAATLGSHLLRRARGVPDTPLRTDQVRVVSLREETPSGYFVSVQFGDGRRREFRIWGEEYVRLAEGDIGLLTYRGESYQSFVHTPEDPAAGDLE